MFGNTSTSTSGGGLFGNTSSSTGGLFGNKPASGGLFSNSSTTTNNTATPANNQVRVNVYQNLQRTDKKSERTASEFDSMRESLLSTNFIR